MPRIDPDHIKRTRSLLTKKRVFTFTELLSRLHCSVRTGRLKLKQWQTYTSYNENGRYYTMPTVPRFNENGLWSYEGIFFSKHGNLKKTVVHLVNASPSGLAGKQIGDILGMPARSFLHHFRDVPGLCRQKHEGVYVYYSDDEDRYQQQVQNRNQIDELKGICDMDAIVILVALIRHHRIGVEQILALPEIKSRGLSHRKIEVFLKSHGLEKKTPPSKP